MEARFVDPDESSCGSDRWSKCMGKDTSVWGYLVIDVFSTILNLIWIGWCFYLVFGLLRPLVVLGRQDRFIGFFTDFLEYLIKTFCIKAGYIRLFC